MSSIEWHTETVLAPAELTLQQACESKGILPTAVELSRPSVIISQAVLESIHDHLKSDLSREHGGVLVGTPFFDKEMGGYFVAIESSIPALDSIGSSVHLQFTAEAWAHISSVIERDYPRLMVVGWYHSHPGLGVFMSSTDRASQRAFYNHAWSVALVVDPVKHQLGWFKGPECVSVGTDEVITYKLADKQPIVKAKVGFQPHEPLLVEKPIVEPPATRDLTGLFLLSSSLFFLIAAWLIIINWKKRTRTD